MEEYVWVLPRNQNEEVPIGARVLAKFDNRIKIKDDNNHEYWISPQKILRPMHPTSVLGVEDMTDLGDLQEYSILRNLQIRYSKNLIYTYIGSILVAVNPYKSLPIYDKVKMNEYRRKKLGELEPHIFAVADHSYENMRKRLEKRCIVISGESGAGKTESTKLFLQYFAGIAVRQSGKERQILDSNPILEAFGNAKTICNHNSSRFGKYIAINFKTDGSIQSAKIKQYLLEKSRIVSQNKGEANYHIFYAVLNGLSPAEKLKLRLKGPESYNYLGRHSELPQDDKNSPYNFGVIRSAMNVLNFSSSEIWSVFELISAILNLGNIEFKSSSTSNPEEVGITTEEEVANVCALLELSQDHLVDSLTKKTISTHGENVVKLLPKQQAMDSRDAFVKRIYGNLFDFIVDKINRILNAEEKTSDCDIGILDIFGFEQFERNSFEQLCINYANEKLQQFFIGHIFKTEQEQYSTEGISWNFIEYPDNQEILDLIEAGPNSVLSVINDETKFPNGTDGTMLEKLIKFNSENPFFLKPKYNKTLVFGISHFAGVVLYDVQDFLEKNRDACTLDIKRVVLSSQNDFLKRVFAEDFEADSNSYYKKRTETLASKFKTSLDLLMGELNQCEPFFVRCIKPNDVKKPQTFDRVLCCKQLRYSGMTETTKVREAGYPVRHDYVQFVQRYRILLPGTPLAHKVACKEVTLKICKTFFAKFPSADYKLGRTKIFLKHVENSLLENEREKRLYSHVVTIQRMVRGWLERKRYKKLKRAVLLLENRWLEWQNRSKGYKTLNGFYRLQARIRSRQVRLQFRKCRRWIILLQAHCRGFLIRNLVKGRLKEIKSKEQTVEDSSPATFQEFARIYFQDKHDHQFSKKPIKSSLTRLVHPEDIRAAKALWLTILRYTGNASEPKRTETTVSVSSKIREILRRIGKNNESTTQEARNAAAEKAEELYESWLKTQTTNLEKIYFVVGHGIARPEMRDEIYCQICKVISKNPSQKAARHGWDLLNSCVGCFPPSDLFLKGLKAFVREGPAKHVPFCLFRLHRILQHGVSRTRPPCHSEMLAILQQKPVGLDVFLADGMKTSTKIDSTTTAKEMLAAIAKNIRLTDTFGFSLFLAQEGKSMSLGDGANYVLDAIAECEQYVMEIGGNFEKEKWKLYLKREILAPWQDQISDEVSLALTCAQITRGIKAGEYGYDQNDLPTLVAQVCYSEQGRVLPAVLSQVIDHYIPHFVYDFPQVDLMCFKEQTKYIYQQMFGKNQRAINSVRTDIIKYAAENWRLQFSRCFHVPGCIRHSKSSLSYPEVPLVVAVNSSGIVIIDESNEKSIVAQLEYMEIREISRKSVAEDKGYVLKITSYEGMEISLGLHTPFDVGLHELLIKITETLKKYSKFVICVKDYKSLDKSFLEVQKGDLIALTPNYSGKDLLQNYWAEGLNERTQKTGNCLLDCVEIIPTTKKPSDKNINAMRNACFSGKTIHLWQSGDRLKHYSLESYAAKNFGPSGAPIKAETQLWKYSKERLQRPLLIEFSDENLAKEAIEIFGSVLQYTEKKQEGTSEHEEEIVRRIFSSALENDLLRDEVYCQIMKQLTSNTNKESENNSWELMWMLTGLFPCSDNLAKEVKKFLQSRRTIQIARECLRRFYTIMRSPPRKTTPHLLEIEAVKRRPCQILYKIYFPDDSHKFFQIHSLTRVEELQKVILNRLKLDSSRGYDLFVQIKRRLFSIPRDFYVFDYFQCLRKWIEKNNLSVEKWQYQICFMKHTWIDAVPGNNEVVDLKFLYPQEYNKYIQGFYEIPTQDVIKLGALLYSVYSDSTKTQPFRLILPKLIPQKALSRMKIEAWQTEIEREHSQLPSLTEKQCRFQFLNYLHKLPSYNLNYFCVIPDNTNLSNYMLYPVTSNSQLIM